MELMIKNLKKQYGEDQVLKGLNLHYRGNGLICIIGPSGSGKSTLLNLIGGLDEVTGGNIYIDDVDLTRLNGKAMINFRNRYIGFVFQDFHLFKYLTTAENIRLASFVRGKDDIPAAGELIAKVGLSGQEHKHINVLSGGERQRTAIARALINNPKLILADEPTGNLDLENSHKIFKLLKEISRDRLVLVITHDEKLAEQYSDKIYRLDDGLFTNPDSIETVPESKKYEVERQNFYKKGLLKLAGRNLRAKKWQVFTTVLSLMITLLCISLLFSVRTGLNDALQSVYKREFEADLVKLNKEPSTDELLNISTNFIPDDEQSVINRIGNVSFVIPEYFGLNATFDKINYDGTIRMIDNSAYFKDGMSPYIIGQFPETDNEILVSMDEALKYNPNDYQEILGQNLFINFDGSYQMVKIVGIDTAFGETNYYILKGLFAELKADVTANNVKYPFFTFISENNYQANNNTSVSTYISDVDDSTSVKILYGHPIENNDEVLISSAAFDAGADNFSAASFSLDDINKTKIDSQVIENCLAEETYLYPNAIFNSGKTKVKIVGIYQATDIRFILSHDLYTQMIAINPNQLDVYINDLNQYQTTVDRLNSLGYNVYSLFADHIDKITASIKEFTQLFLLLIAVTVGISFVLLYILISNQVTQRMQEFGILKALGTKRKDIVLILMTEGMIMGGIASVLVFFLSFIVAPKINLLLNFSAYGISYNSVRFIHINFYNFIAVLLAGIFFTAAAVILPSIKASKLNPIEAINRG